MVLDFPQESLEWHLPMFKVLAHNDTGAAAGNQAGILIPKALRSYFPVLVGIGSSSQPTIDTRLEAQLFLEGRFLATVSTRYQYQTWAGVRRPESRITDELGPMRNFAEEGDIVIFHRSIHSDHSYRLTLVRKRSALYKLIAGGIGTRRWGQLGSTI